MKSGMSDATDEQLVKQAKKGDTQAYTELVRRYRERIYQTIYGFTRNHSDTDDLAQETFLHAFRSLGQFRKRSGFYTWIYRIAVNLSLNFLKKMGKEKRKESLKESLLARERSLATSPESFAASEELRKKLNEAVDSLPAVYRASFVLVVFQGMTHGQAARIMRCPENTVSWRMHKARKMLQTKLSSYLDEARP